MMKTMILSTFFGVLFIFSASGAFLPEGNGDVFGLEYGESIAGVPPNTPKIDGDLNDWKHAVWIAFDSEKKAGLVFMDWHGLNPDDSGNLGTLTFGGPLAVDVTGKLTLTWGQLKQLVK